jgi:undecaprenyl-diphosphooligosaccharide--protein glycosyltransferase
MERAPMNRTALAGLCMLAAGMLLNFLLAVHHAALLLAVGCRVDGVLAVTNNDGYYHLDHARAFAAQGMALSGPWTGSMLLSRLLALLGGTDITGLLAAAAPIGPVLGLTMLLAVLPWAEETEDAAVVFLAPLLALLSPYWIDRTHLGVVDTDVLSPFLAYASLYCVMRFSTSAIRRTAWAAGYAGLLCLHWLWWKPGAFMAVGFIGCYLLYRPRQRGDLTAKLALLASVVCSAALALARVAPFADWYDYIAAHIALAFGGSGGSLLSDAIMELHPLTLAELGDKALGSAWLLPLSLIGAILYGLRFRWKSLFLLLPGAAFGIAALLSRRFIPFFTPAAALLAVYCAARTCRWFAARSRTPQGRRIGRFGSLAAAVVILFAGSGARAVEYVPESYFSAQDFALAGELKRSFPANTTVWTWWDYGYFFRFLTSMPVYFDGGSQTDATCFTAAYPLMQPDLLTAARWIRHFSRQDRPALDLSRRGAGWPQYIAEYTAENMNGVTDTAHPVALCLPARVYTTVGYLYAFAHVFDEHPPAVANHLDLFDKGDFRYDRDAGTVVVPQAVVDKGYAGFGSVLDLTGKEPDQFDFAALPDPYLAYSEDTDFLAVTDKTTVRSVLFRLLGLYRSEPMFFEPVQPFAPNSGGLWRVLPPQKGETTIPTFDIVATGGIDQFILQARSSS